MKIQEKTYLALQMPHDHAWKANILKDATLAPEFWEAYEQLSEEEKAANSPQMYQQRNEANMREMLSEAGNRHLLITKTVLEECRLIKVGRNFNYAYLHTLKHSRGTIIHDKKEFFRYIIKKDRINATYFKEMIHPTEGRECVQFSFFYIDAASGQAYYPRELPWAVFQQFIQLLIFLEFAAVEEVVIKAGGKVGTKLNGFKNESRSPVIVVKSDWNRRLIIESEDDKKTVSGHYKMVAHGPAYSLRTLTWINPYKKKGEVAIEAPKVLAQPANA
jgi:hypothetical protein